jgi:hypothetical protein
MAAKGWDITNDETDALMVREAQCCWHPNAFTAYHKLDGTSYRVIQNPDGKSEAAVRVNRQDGWIVLWDEVVGTSGVTNVFVMDPNGNNKTQLTDTRGVAEPIWAGGDHTSWVVFMAGWPEWYIAAMRADAAEWPGGVIRLSSTSGYNGSPAWTPFPADGANHAPAAEAGPAQTVACAGTGGTATTLDGSASSDPDGDTLTYSWTGPFPEGNGTVTGANPTVTLPLGPSTVTLIVNDGRVDSEPDTVAVSVFVSVEGFAPPLGALVPEGDAVQTPDRAYKQGRTLPLKLQVLCGGASVCQAGVVAPRIVGLARSGEALNIETLDLDAGNANDGGVEFRPADCHWVYNLNTRNLVPGSYAITVQMTDKSRWVGGFVLR